MQAAQINEYGGTEVLEIAEAPEPHPGPGQVRVVVHAASINAVDWKIRAGYMKDQMPVEFPAILGNDAAGVVDEIGDGVSGVRLGDAVFGLGSRTNAEFALLDAYVPKPRSLDWAEAAAVTVGAETTARALGLVDLSPGDTLLIDGAAGGVGSIAVQLAASRGYTVIGTASERNHEFLRQLGATPVLYGDGLVDRVRALAPDGVKAVYDVVGASDIADLISLVDRPSQVVSIANFTAGQAGAQITTGGEGDPVAALQEAADLAEAKKLAVEVRTFPLADIAEAHELSQGGHVRGKLVLVI
jgi:NADPH:quinone reductase-like Zn-dependent oxidoreductase